MNAREINDAISEAIVARGCFIVDISVSKDNDISIIMESEEGVVTLEDCEAVNDAFTALYDRDVEDYSLTVSSAGLDRPFKVMKQLTKAIGTKVEAALKGGRKFVATLQAADEENLTLDGEVLPRSQVNWVRPYVTFE